MVVTNDTALADIVRKLRTHGGRTKFRPETLGWNSRLDELQAAILRVKLKYLDAWNERRRQIARRYHDLLDDTGVGLPREAPYAKHVYHLYVVRSAHRKALQDHLAARKVATARYYPLPLHHLTPYQNLGQGSSSLPESERAAEETLAIPLYAEMTDDDISRVASTIKEALPSE
jgi:dTDP-4-amino-4,6-dideoxygalactose transaminase